MNYTINTLTKALVEYRVKPHVALKSVIVEMASALVAEYYVGNFGSLVVEGMEDEGITGVKVFYDVEDHDFLGKITMGYILVDGYSIPFNASNGVGEYYAIVPQVKYLVDEEAEDAAIAAAFHNGEYALSQGFKAVEIEELFSDNMKLQTGLQPTFVGAATDEEWAAMKERVANTPINKL